MLFHRLAMEDPKPVTADTTLEIKPCTTFFTAVVRFVQEVEAAVLMLVHRLDNVVPRLVMKFVTSVTRVFTRLEILVVIPVQMLLAVLLMVVHMELKVCDIPLNSVVQWVTMPSTEEPKICFRPSRTPPAASFRLPRMFWTSERIWSKSPVTRSQATRAAPPTAFFSPSK